MDPALPMTSHSLSDAFFESLDSSITDVSTAQTLPPTCYTSAAFFEFEKEALFSHEWLCLGRASWAAKPGDFFATRVVGEPLLAVRGEDGELRVMSAVCQQSAAIVATGRGNTDSFQSPGCAVRYALDGTVLTTAGSRVRALPQLKVELWMGFVFANFDSAASSMAPGLSAVESVIGHWDCTTADGPVPDPAERYPCNWKVMLENNNDGYHANKLHHGPLHDFVPSDLARFPDLPSDSGGYYRFNGTLHPDASFNITQKALMPIFPALTAEERSRVMFANVPPTLSLGFTCDLIMYFILRPDSATTHEMDFGLLFAPGAMDDPRFAARLALIRQTMAAITVQDLHVDEQIQIGLASRFAIRGRYSWQEGAQRLLNCWLVPRYQAAWNRLKANA
ncbi:aromatic ring-hydroxylating dioxygenase subunit alpha [soil metagenome]